jgi:hypothetical protein
MSKSETCCALCMIDGIWSKPVDHWPYIPICQEHLAETLVRTGTNRQNVISLADMRRKLRPPPPPEMLQ